MSNKDLNNSNLESNSFQEELAKYKNNPDAQKKFRENIKKYAQKREADSKITTLLPAKPAKTDQIEEIKNQIKTINLIDKPKSDFETTETPIENELTSKTENNPLEDTEQELQKTINENPPTPEEIAEVNSLVKESLILVEEINKANNKRKEELRKFLAEGGYKTEENIKALKTELKALGIAIAIDTFDVATIVSALLTWFIGGLGGIPTDYGIDALLVLSAVLESSIRKFMVKDYYMENKTLFTGMILPAVNPVTVDLANRTVCQRTIPTLIFLLKDKIQNLSKGEFELIQIEGKTKIVPENKGEIILHKLLKTKEFSQTLDRILDFQFKNTYIEKSGDYIRFFQIYTIKKIKEIFTLDNITKYFINKTTKQIETTNPKNDTKSEKN